MDLEKHDLEADDTMSSDIQETSDEITTSNQPGTLPKDRGWAWVILAGAWMNMFLMVGPYRTSGILFIEIQRKYGSNSSMTSLIPSVLNATFSVSTLVVSTIGLNYFSTRQSVMTGSVIIATAYILAAFAPSVEILIVLIGGMLGTGQGFMMAPTTSILGQYFDKRRSLANCAASMGWSVGSLLFPVIVRACLDNYGLSGTLLLLGAMCLHGLLSGATMRTTSFYTKTRTMKTKNKDNSDSNSIETDSGISVKNATFPEKYTEIQIYSTKGTNSPLLYSNPTLYPRGSIMARKSRRRTLSEQGKANVVGSIASIISSPGVGRYASTEFTVSSMLDVSKISKDNVNKKSPEVHTMTNSQSSCCCNSTSGILNRLCTIIDCKVLRHLPFLCFLPCAWCLCTASSSAQTFLPPIAKDQGLTDEMGGFLITLTGCVDMCATLIWGVIADKGWIKTNNVIAAANVVLGIATYFFPFYTSVWTFVLYCVIYGLMGRVYFSIYPVVLVDFLGLDNLKSALGITILSQSGALSLLLPVIGLMRDLLGTYVPSYQLIAFMLVIGGIGMTLLPLAEKYGRKRKLESCTDGNDVHVVPDKTDEHS